MFITSALHRTLVCMVWIDERMTTKALRSPIPSGAAGRLRAARTDNTTTGDGSFAPAPLTFASVSGASTIQSGGSGTSPGTHALSAADPHSSAVSFSLVCALRLPSVPTICENQQESSPRALALPEPVDFLLHDLSSRRLDTYPSPSSSIRTARADGGVNQEAFTADPSVNAGGDPQTPHTVLGKRALKLHAECST
eukprot:1184400-Rhodomonas_salina.2